MKVSVKKAMDIISEEKNREDRKNNVIIYRAKESEAYTPVGKQMDDAAFCITLIEVILDVPRHESDLKRVFHVG